MIIVFLFLLLLNFIIVVFIGIYFYKRKNFVLIFLGDIKVGFGLIKKIFLKKEGKEKRKKSRDSMIECLKLF